MVGDRSMVGQCPLEAFIQVRILVAQPEEQLFALGYLLLAGTCENHRQYGSAEKKLKANS
jgi:hypothetical protein